MTEQEKPLSDKIQSELWGIDKEGGIIKYYFWEKDLKLTIKQLKDRIDTLQFHHINTDVCRKVDAIELIDKIFGKELTE